MFRTQPTGYGKPSVVYAVLFHSFDAIQGRFASIITHNF